ncbi:MAG: diguanylate cyclase [Burkholderiales bacterium]|nr:diguanylate cyclase [Burkholderiales bacterium]
MSVWRSSSLKLVPASLKWRITLGTIVVVSLSVFGITAELIRSAEADTLIAQREREMADAALAAAMLSRRVVELQRVLQASAEQFDRDTVSDDARLSALLGAKPVLRAVFSGVFVATADGRIRMQADQSGVRPPALNIADRDYFVRTLKEARPIVSAPMKSRLSGDPIVILTYPLKGPQGVVHGVLAGTLRLADRSLLADLSELHREQSQAILIITDSAGQIIAHPERARLLDNLGSESRLARAYAQWVDEGRIVEPSGLHLNQPGELVSAAGVPGPDWVVWRGVPQAELLQPLLAARHHAMVWAIGLVLILSLLSALAVARMLRPLAQLEQRALRLFDQDQPAHEGWPSAGGEIGRLTGVLRQASIDRAALAARNDETLRRLRSVMSSAPIGIAFTRAKCFELVSDELCRMLGRPEAELLGQPTLLIYANSEDFETVGAQVAQAFAAGRPYVGECKLRRADGNEFWAQLRGRPVDAGDQAAGTIWTVVDIGHEVAERTQLEWSASHDVLTGLANRKAFEARLAQTFGSRPLPLPATLLVIDLDHFKPINDESGHVAGDAVLKAVATAITGCVRANDLAVRTGGDEFAVLLEHCSQEAALRVAEDICSAVARIALPWEGRTLRVGASVGSAALASDMADATVWVEAADAACYAAKAAGRGMIKTASSASAPRPVRKAIDADTSAA